VRELYDADTVSSEDYRIEGKKLLTNQDDDVYVLYTKVVTDPTEFSKSFVETLAMKIARTLSVSEAESNTLHKTTSVLLAERVAFSELRDSSEDQRTRDKVYSNWTTQGR
jgi:hypothetical protein